MITVRRRTIAIAILLPTLSLIAAMVLLLNKPIPSSPPQTEASREQSSSAIKQNNDGNVEIAVTPQEIIVGKPVIFTVSLNTHSVPLDFDLPAISTLTDDQGNVLGPATWEGTPPGGHHREGTLTFSTALPKQTKTIALTLTDIAGVAARTFTWEVASL